MQITSGARGPTRFPARCRRTSWASSATWRRTACPSTSSAKSTRCAYELSLCFFNLLTVSPASPEILRFSTGPEAAWFRRHRRRLGRAKLCLLGRGQGEVGIVLQNILVWLVGWRPSLTTNFHQSTNIKNEGVVITSKMECWNYN